LLDRHFAWFLLSIVSGFVNQKSITQSRHDLDRIFGLAAPVKMNR
jgi:hypothetical protein